MTYADDYEEQSYLEHVIDEEYADFRGTGLRVSPTARYDAILMPPPPRFDAETIRKTYPSAFENIIIHRDLRNKLEGNTMPTNANPNDVRNHSIGFLKEWKAELTQKMSEVDAELERRERERQPVRPTERYFKFNARYKNGSASYEFVVFQPGAGQGRLYITGQNASTFQNWNEMVEWLKGTFRWVSDFQPLRVTAGISYASNLKGDDA